CNSTLLRCASPLHHADAESASSPDGSLRNLDGWSASPTSVRSVIQVLGPSTPPALPGTPKLAAARCSGCSSEAGSGAAALSLEPRARYVGVSIAFRGKRQQGNARNVHRHEPLQGDQRRGGGLR